MNIAKGTNNSFFIITGFMLAGKSYAAKLASNALNYDFVDLDSQIEKKINKSISSIFKEYGEEPFRSLESEIFASFLQVENKRLIMAVGGGFPILSRNQTLMKEARTIFLNTSIDLILSRLTPSEFIKRPLLPAEPSEIKKLYERRYEIYINTADYIVHDSEELIKLIQDLERGLVFY